MPANPSPARHTDVRQDPRWATLLARKSGDAAFVYAVKTTGIYGRPGSASRLPRPENIEFFDSPQAAEAAGYRPSRRADADARGLEQRNASLIAKACRRIEAAERAPTLVQLARDAGMSSFHFHRVFKSVTGMTPQSYGAAHRAKRLRDGLADSRSVTDAIYDSGFGSQARFYAQARGALGMNPTSFRAGGVDTVIRFALAQCSLGTLLVAQSEHGVCAIAMGDDPDTLVRDFQDRFARAELIGADAQFEDHVARVLAYIEQPGSTLALPLDVRGTAFQLRVWQALREIPVGSTASYAQIAQRIGAPRSVRAVARACASNPLAIAIPCHRVVRSDGGLSGYRWGIERKRELLQREGVPSVGRATGNV